MKALCSIIRDVLPLYYDNVCSKESRAMVDEHLQECDECRKVLEALSDELTHPVNAIDEIKPIKAIKEGIEKRKRNSVLKGVVIAVLICAILAGGYFILTQQRSLSIDYISTSEPYMLSDGRVVFQYNFDDRVQTVLFAGYDGVGTVHMIPRSSIVGGKQKSMQPVYQGMNAVWCITVFREYIVIDTSDVTAFYIGSGDNEILMWDRGMELPPASAELERLFNNGNNSLLNIDRIDENVILNSSPDPAYESALPYLIVYNGYGKFREIYALLERDDESIKEYFSIDDESIEVQLNDYNPNDLKTREDIENLFISLLDLHFPYLEGTEAAETSLNIGYTEDGRAAEVPVYVMYEVDGIVYQFTLNASSNWGNRPGPTAEEVISNWDDDLDGPLQIIRDEDGVIIYSWKVNPDSFDTDNNPGAIFIMDVNGVYTIVSVFNSGDYQSAVDGILAFKFKPLINE